MKLRALEKLFIIYTTESNKFDKVTLHRYTFAPKFDMPKFTIFVKTDKNDNIIFPVVVANKNFTDVKVGKADAERLFTDIDLIEFSKELESMKKSELKEYFDLLFIFTVVRRFKKLPFLGEHTYASKAHKMIEKSIKPDTLYITEHSDLDFDVNNDFATYYEECYML